MGFWDEISQKLRDNHPVGLLYVLRSSGSSPGRQGFRMWITDQELSGTIGGGIMEHKLVELLRRRLDRNEKGTMLKPQIHGKDGKDRSGMICSGEQWVALTTLGAADISTVDQFSEAEAGILAGILEFNRDGLFFIAGQHLLQYDFGLKKESQNGWTYREALKSRPVIHIIGAGHVGLQLSKLMHDLGFYVKLYDDRPDLNTFLDSEVADERHVVEYGSITDKLKPEPQEYVAVMTFGYRTDLIVLREILAKEVRYLGVLGSDSKIADMVKELAKEGFSRELLETVRWPIGIPILSKTGIEIAVSVAAEIIYDRNINLPTGRHLGKGKSLYDET